MVQYKWLFSLCMYLCSKRRRCSNAIRLLSPPPHSFCSLFSCRTSALSVKSALLEHFPLLTLGSIHTYLNYSSNVVIYLISPLISSTCCTFFQLTQQYIRSWPLDDVKCLKKRNWVGTDRQMRVPTTMSAPPDISTLLIWLIQCCMYKFVWSGQWSILLSLLNCTHSTYSGSGLSVRQTSASVAPSRVQYCVCVERRDGARDGERKSPFISRPDKK